MLEPLRRLRHVWLRVPRKVMWLQRTKAVQCTHAALASLATSHLELSFLCFGNAQASTMSGLHAHRSQFELGVRVPCTNA